MSCVPFLVLQGAQASVRLQILLSKEGGSQPFFLRRLAYLGWRYLVFRFLRLLRTARRLARALVICSPRCSSSAAKTTSPVASLTSASPVVLLPGSILTRNGSRTGCSTRVLRMIVKGYRFNTAALPEESSRRALPGCTGFNGCLWVSRTNTLLMRASSREGNGGLDKVMERFDVQHTAFTRYSCLMLYRRGWGWPRTQTYLNSLLT